MKHIKSEDDNQSQALPSTSNADASQQDMTSEDEKVDVETISNDADSPLSAHVFPPEHDEADDIDIAAAPTTSSSIVPPKLRFKVGVALNIVTLRRESFSARQMVTLYGGCKQHLF